MSSDPRIEQILDLITRVASGDLTAKLSHSYKHDVLDGIILGMNMLAEELHASMVSRDIYKEEKEKAQYLNSIIESTTDFIAMVNSDGQLLFLNNAGRKMVGIGMQEDISKTYIQEYHPEWVNKIIFEEKIPYAIEHSACGMEISALLTRDGREIPCSQVIVVNKNDDGKVATFASIMRDVTELRKLEKKLYQAQKMEALGTLAGGIAHDFNNILAIIFGYAELGKIDASLDCFDEILLAAKRGKEMTKQILTFSRMKPIFQPLDIGIAIEESLKMVKKIIPANIKIHQKLQPCDNIIADLTQLHQLVFNLCTNACHAMQERGGILKIELKKLNPHENAEGIPYAMLNIEDNGCGIPIEIQEKIFDPFFTTKKIGKGTGLGLAIVHGIVKKHKGKITIASEVDKGTTVKIIFPITTEKEGIVVKEKSHIKQGREHILIVEDEIVLCQIYQKFLEKAGYTSTVCHNGAKALDLFKENPSLYDLVFTDQTMPKLTGKQLSQQLLAIQPNIPIILATGYSEAINKQEALSLGVCEFLIKPVKLEHLTQLICSHCEQRKAL